MRRRLIILGLVLLVPPLLFSIFVLIFKPKDDLQLLRPYVQSAHSSYYELKSEPGVLRRTRQYTLYGMPRKDAFEKANDILVKHYAKRGWLYEKDWSTWQGLGGGMANIFGRLDVEEWQGRRIQPFPDDQIVPDTYPFYFQESGVRVNDWRELVWARATGSIRRF